MKGDGVTLCERKCGSKHCLDCSRHARQWSRNYPIQQRIIDAIKKHGKFGFIKYYDLARLVFPKEHMPGAWNSPAKGGPPGCYMVLSRAIREHQFYINHDGDAVVYSTVGLGKNKT